jgi:RNA polymerase sigma factor (sigma-70 family)
MPEPSDMDLVRAYARDNSGAAFTELVHRHINLVYSVALRFTHNSEDAQDVTQAVFIILAQKAARLRDRTILTGWLYETTRFVAAKLLRTKVRRQAREQEAYMQSTSNEPETDSVWRLLAPHLEEAMSGLGERDRTLLALRFYENKSGAEAAVLLGIREDAAHKRTARAVEKLRTFFGERGIALSAVAITSAVSGHSVQTAPVALAKSVTAVAMAKGATASSSTLALIKGALKLMAWSQAKTAVVVGAGILVAAGTATLVVKTATRPSVSSLSTTDLSWADDPKYWDINFGDPDPRNDDPTTTFARVDKTFKNLPPVLIIRPTRFHTNLGEIGSNDKILGRGRTLVDLLRDAYDPHMSSGWMLPANFSREEKFDLMLTLTNKPREALAGEIKNRFGYVAHFETISTNALLLTVKNPAGPALLPTQGGNA